MNHILNWLVISLLFVFISCKKESDPCKESNLKEGYIIGFDQCTAGKQSFEGKGFVLVTNNFRDTLLTYNLPDSLYSFPPSHFAYFQFSYLFPDSVRFKYKVYFAYRSVEESEKFYPLCRGDILTDELSRLFLNGRNQIKILCIHPSLLRG